MRLAGRNSIAYTTTTPGDRFYLYVGCYRARKGKARRMTVSPKLMARLGFNWLGPET